MKHHIIIIIRRRRHSSFSVKLRFGLLKTDSRERCHFVSGSLCLWCHQHLWGPLELEGKWSHWWAVQTNLYPNNIVHSCSTADCHVSKFVLAFSWAFFHSHTPSILPTRLPHISATVGYSIASPRCQSFREMAEKGLLSDSFRSNDVINDDRGVREVCKHVTFYFTLYFMPSQT